MSHRIRAAVLGFSVLAWLAGASIATAQTDPDSSADPGSRTTTSVMLWHAPGQTRAADSVRSLFTLDAAAPFAAVAQPAATPDDRACEGCPRRSVGEALFQSLVITVLYNLGNRTRPGETQYMAVTPKTWWANMKYGFEWDQNGFAVNQFGHPYQGNNYYTAARANGLSFWESAPVAAFGSATWEYFGETNKPSVNDFINTTLGGIALGEMFHRTAWLVRDTTSTEKSRLVRELVATWAT